jgi:glycosyltransferase involved in cell wall biosynthesis
MIVSIITCSFNSDASISDTLTSILNQTNNEFEIISIDGNSLDNTNNIISNSLRSSDFHLSEKDNGIYDALNKGIKNANGDIIGILHSDDVYSSTNILEQVNALFSKTNCDGVYGNLNFIKNGKIVRKWESRKFVPFLLNKGWMPPHPTLFLKKVVFEKHGLYDTNFKIAADYDFILRIFKDESLKFEYLPITIINMSIGGVSTSGFRNLIRKSFEDYKVLKKNNMKYPLLILFRKIVGKISQFYAI